MNRGVNRLENIKRDEISRFSNYEWLPNWEIFLTSDYWKSWRTKISVCQTEKELSFYIKRLREIADLISSCKKYGDDDLLIKKEEKRLESISEEDFKKEDKFADVEFKELSLEEMSSDPWFSKQLGLDNQEKNQNKKDNDSDIDYKIWTKEQLISEINRLKAENEQLKNNQTLTSSERQTKLQQNQQKLEKLESSILNSSSSNDTNNRNNSNLGTAVIIGSVLVVASLGIYGIVKKSKKIKK